MLVDVLGALRLAITLAVCRLRGLSALHQLPQIETKGGLDWGGGSPNPVSNFKKKRPCCMSLSLGKHLCPLSLIRNSPVACH